MNRGEMRRRLALAWWVRVALALAPLFCLNLLFGAGRQPGVLAMPLFIAGLLAMFASLPLFGAYKRALVATEKALDSPQEADAWQALGLCRGRAMWVAALPAWIAAVAVFSGLEGIPLLLLGLSSLVLLYLYRIPRQLG